MQEYNRKKESILSVISKWLVSFAISTGLLLLMTMPATVVCLLLDRMPHAAVYPWAKALMMLLWGFVTGRLFASFCKLKGLVCGLITGLGLITGWLLGNWIVGAEGLGGVFLSGLLLLGSSLAGGVFGACRRN